MQVVGLDEDCRDDIVSVVAGILHLGNITFVEKGNYAAIADPGCKFERTLGHQIRGVFENDFSISRPKHIWASS